MYLKRLLYILLILLPSNPIYALTKITLNENFNNIAVGKYIEIYEDKNNQFNINTILSSSINFEKSNNDKPNFGYSKSTFWVRFLLSNDTVKDITTFLELHYPTMDLVTLFVVNKDRQIIKTETSGDNILFNGRVIKNRNPIFQINVRSKSETLCYMKFNSEGSIQIPLLLWEPISFYNKDHNTQLIYGVYFGIVLIMLMYNLFLYLSIRDITYLTYILYICGVSSFVFTINGFGFEYIWSDFPYLANMSLPFTIALTGVGGSLFTRHFLKTKENTPFMDIIIKILLFSNFIVMIGCLFIKYSILIKTIAIIAVFFGFILFPTGLICLYRGYRPARYYVAAWLLFLLGTVLFALRNFGLFPIMFISEYGVEIGSAIETFLLSLALADRINIMKKEKEEAQEKILQISKSYSDSLEITVNQRTSELEIEKNKLKLKNSIMENDVALARKIQLQLIPAPNPTKYIYSFYKPMQEVGGDLYDFISFKNSEKIGIFISDVSGHGVAAAFITSMVKTTILQSGNRKENPAELLHYINEVLHNQTADNFITAFYGIYNPGTRSILYANAGHPQPYIITEKSVDQLPKGRSTFLAIFNNNLLSGNNKLYQNFEEILPQGSKLLFYTDGLTEASPIGSNIFYEDDVMLEIFKENVNFSSEVFISKLYESLIKFRNDESFEDDVCLVCLDVI